jgi:3-hydroxyisobutyrate dehydrogenase-like beta-hydroxyacid dehydrogenase
MLEVAEENNVPLFLWPAVKQLYELARAEGSGEEDHTAIVKICEEFTGLKWNSDPLF